MLPVRSAVDTATMPVIFIFAKFSTAKDHLQTKLFLKTHKNVVRKDVVVIKL